MDVTLFLLGSATALCTAGFFGWVLELAGWEEKKMAQWADGCQWPIELIQYWPLKLTHPSVRLFYIPDFCFSR